MFTYDIAVKKKNIYTMYEYYYLPRKCLKMFGFLHVNIQIPANQSHSCMHQVVVVFPDFVDNIQLAPISLKLTILLAHSTPVL